MTKTHWTIGFEYHNKLMAFTSDFQFVSPLNFAAMPFPTEELAMEYLTKFGKTYVSEALKESVIPSYVTLKLIPVTTTVGEPKDLG